ncbi:MAG TPA: glycerol kinase GlpK [Chloroflexi bacterium]|jgi:glycerol kinase|nr:glycerol kinase GlpK [Chloroflexota bacterium]
MGDYVAAIDQGTTGTRCMIVDRAGRVIASDYAEHRQILPQAGWVEHDPLEIWAKTQEVVIGALAAGRLRPADVRVLGIANQRETTVVWDRQTGQPLYNAIVWQCTRTAEQCQQLIRAGLEPLIRERTGLLVATYFAATKLLWLLENVPGVRDAAERGDALFGTIDTWLIWNLTGGPRGGVHVTDVTNASRTMLMNLETLDWDPGLLAALGIPRAMLPAIRPSSEAASYGTVTGIVADSAPLDWPVCGALGDQQAALVGQACFAPGEAKNTYGTGSFMLMNTGERPVASTRGLLTTVGYHLGAGRCAYALEGSIAATGAAVQWLRDNLGLIADAAETEAIAATVPDTGGVYFVPAFSGLYAPHWDMYARGVIVGLTRFTNRAHLVRATLEAICYQAREILDAMESDSGIGLRSLKVDGGAVVNDLLMQLQADILGVPVVRPTVRETTALGAAYAAGLAVGVWSTTDELRQHWGEERTFFPQWDDARRAEGYRGWARAVERSRGWMAP